MANTNDSSGPGTTVGVNVALTGTLRDQNDIVIFGMVDGEVISEKSVTVGKTAQVKGPIRGKMITIAGVVRGSIDASEKLELVDSGKVYGSIATRDLVIHSGATFVGKSAMEGVEGELTEEGEAAEKETDKPSKDKGSKDEEAVEVVPTKDEELPLPDEN